jgi:hypothetical protein
MTMRMAQLMYLGALLAISGGEPRAETRPAHIILIRHAEKPLDQNNPHLTPAGVERAKHLVTFVTTNNEITSLGHIAAIFATQTTKHDDGQRTQETVAPLAAALRLPVQTPFLGKGYAELARMILANPAYSGKTIFICWNHESLPELAAALGVVPMPRKWKGGVFNTVYVISYSGGKASLSVLDYE